MSSDGLAFGVTGHRNLAGDDARLTTLVRDEMRRAQTELASPARTADTVVSPLAEGADRLVARVGLELGMRLVVPLPMPVDAYAMDFGGEASTIEFKALLAKATSVIEAPLLSEGDAWRRYTEERNHQYAWVGAYLVATCDVLIALWDGKPARGTGGTGTVVEWFVTGVLPPTYHMQPKRLAPGRVSPAMRLVHIVPETFEVRRQDVRR
jgi:hypothetical protein